MRHATWPSTARRSSRRSGRSALMKRNRTTEEDTVRRVTRHAPHPVTSLMGDLAMGSLRLVWRLVRLPILTFLVILQPVVGLVLGGLALMGVLMSFFFKLSGAAPHFPFLIMLAISVGFGLALIGYEALIRYVSR